MRTRVRLLTAAATTLLLAGTAPTPHQAAAALAAGDLGTCLAAVCGALAALVAVVLAAGSLLVLLAELPGRVGAVADVLARRCLPRVLRAALVAALGLGSAALPATAAGADTHRPATTRLVPDLDRPAVGRPALIAALPAPTPTRTPAATPTAHRNVTPPTPAAPATAPRDAEPVLVRPGDTLWSIAAHALGTGASDRAVAAAWPRWWQANRDVIGDNPDLIRPGQQLTPPAHLTTREDRP